MGLAKNQGRRGWVVGGGGRRWGWWRNTGSLLKGLRVELDGLRNEMVNLAGTVIGRAVRYSFAKHRLQQIQPCNELSPGTGGIVSVFD